MFSEDLPRLARAHRRGVALVISFLNKDLRLRSFQPMCTDCGPQTGLNDKTTPGVWRYATTGTDVVEVPTYYNWRRKFPRLQHGRHRKETGGGAGNGGNCVVVAKKMEWINRPCDSSRSSFVCLAATRRQTTSDGRPRRQSKRPGGSRS